MNWLSLASKEWRRRPLRTGVTASGIAIAVAALFSLLAFHDGYRDGVQAEISRLGAHVLVVPKGCPYDAASMALHGANWPCYLKANHFAEVAGVPGVESAAPALMAALPGSNGAQTVYVGIDERMFTLKTEWKLDGAFPHSSGEIVAGSEAARMHGWKVGKRVNLPGLPGESGVVRGILRPTHGSDDTFLYARLEDAQRWFQKPEQLTHILVKLKNSTQLESTVTSLRGCDAGMDMNVVPLSHLFRTIQALVNSTRLLLGCIALIALLVAATGVSNAMLMSVTERSREIGIMRAIGASRVDVFCLVWLETLQVCIAGGIAGVLVAFASSHWVEAWLRSRLPFAPTDPMVRWDWAIAGMCLGGAVVLGCFAALLPASRAAELSPVEAMREGAKV
jgi:putative ABC transport system permease protein